MKLRAEFALAAFAASVLVGCGPAGYVPGPEFKTVVTLSAANTALKVGQPLKLSATRETSGWVETEQAEKDPEKCFFRRKPEDESEVAANLGWKVTPSGIARFDVPQTLREAQSRSMNRWVTFSKPGEYLLKGHSALYCGGTWSNEVTITVTE